MSRVEPVIHTCYSIADDLEHAGIGPGDNVIMHSSLKSVGPTENGPETIIEALLKVIGPAGNLMVPTFTYCLPVWNTEPYHPAKSKSRVGAITEYLRNRPDAVRSFHPTHSVGVIGPDRGIITADHIEATPIGKNSPFDRMLHRGAHILMLGTFQDTNSSLHLCEVLAGLPYIHVPFSNSQSFELAWFINQSDQVEYVQINEVPGCSRGFRAIEAELIAHQVLKPVRVGNAECQLLELAALRDVALEVLRRDPLTLLCHIENCAICPKRRQFMNRLQA